MKEELIKKIEELITNLEERVKPLRDEYNLEYRLWFEKGYRNPVREKLLIEYESGSKGLSKFDKEIRIQQLKEVLEIIKNI